MPARDQYATPGTRELALFRETVPLLMSAPTAMVHINGRRAKKGLPLSRGLYKFTQNLLDLEAASPPRSLVPHDSSLATPLKLPVWQSSLDAFPDRPLAQYILRGISQGFRIGVNQTMEQKPSRRNLKSAYEHPEVVSAYLQREVDLGRMLPLQPSPDLVPPSIQISPFGVIPKRYKPDKWRLITDLSSPQR